MSGVRVSLIPLKCTEKDLKIYFSKNGGAKLKEIYYPLFNNDAVVILENELETDAVVVHSGHYLRQDPINVKRLPLQVFPKLTADIDTTVANYLQATEEIRDEIEHFRNVTLNRDKGGNLVSMSGNWYQLEWTWNKIDTTMREQIDAQTTAESEMQFKGSVRRRQPDTYDTNQDAASDECRELVPPPMSSKELVKKKTTEKHSSNHPLFKHTGDKLHEAVEIPPSVSSMHQSLHGYNERSVLHASSNDDEHSNNILHDPNRDDDHEGSILHESSRDDGHASSILHDRNRYDDHQISILQARCRDDIHPSSILHESSRDDGHASSILHDRNRYDEHPSSILQARCRDDEHPSSILHARSRDDEHPSSVLHARSRDDEHPSSVLHAWIRDDEHPSSILHARSRDDEHPSSVLYARAHASSVLHDRYRYDELHGAYPSSILYDRKRDNVLHGVYPSSSLHDTTRHEGSLKHGEVGPNDWDDPGHEHHGQDERHLHFSASAKRSYCDKPQLKVKPHIQYLTQNPDEIKFLDFEFGFLAVNVYVGLITMAETDVIVNAAKGSLINGAGVAWAIASNASPELQKQCDKFVKTKGSLQTSEVMHTCAGGKLNPNVKYVIHAVGPVWSRAVGEIICTHQLIMAFLNSFSYGNDILKISSISVPLISSGIFGCPVEMCAKAFLYAVLLYTYGHPAARCSLRSIHLVNNDDANTALTILALKQLIAEGAERLLTDAEQLMSEAAHATAAVSSKTAPVNRVTGQKLELEDDGDRMRIQSRTEVSHVHAKTFKSASD